MRVAAGRGGKFCLARESLAGIAEDKVIVFSVQADRQFHEYRVEPRKHAIWAGQIIMALRIDPVEHVQPSKFASDYIRAEMPASP